MSTKAYFEIKQIDKINFLGPLFMSVNLQNWDFSIPTLCESDEICKQNRDNPACLNRDGWTL